jgi:hypothetical protein
MRGMSSPEAGCVAARQVQKRSASAWSRAVALSCACAGAATTIPSNRASQPLPRIPLSLS